MVATTFHLARKVFVVDVPSQACVLPIWSPTSIIRASSYSCHILFEMPGTSAQKRRDIDDMDLDEIVMSTAVQRALPDLVGLYDDADYELMLSNPPSSISAVPMEVRRTIKSFATQLDRHERLSSMWKHQVSINYLQNFR